MSRKPHKLFDRGDTVGSFTIIDLIGQGGYGDIYSVKPFDSDIPFAIKIEALSAPKRALEKEIFYLSKVQSSYFFPHLYEAGFTATHTYAVMDLLGPSISVVRRRMPEQCFSLTTALRLSLAMLQSLQALHSLGFIHGDVKPGNFLLSPTPSQSPIVLIDFGFAKRYVNPATGVRYPEGPKCGFRGTMKYASIYVHRGHDQSPRDDLIAWLYSTVELVDGSLPWSRESDSYRVRMHKKSISNSELLRSFPAEFVDVARYLKSLSFGSDIRYEYLICLVSTAVRCACPSLGQPYDWENTLDGDALPCAADYSRNIPWMPLAVLSEDSVDEDECACTVA
jgi:serine/threonine protein kinase